MPTPIDEVLFEIRLLKSWLYGEGQGHEGDIPQMKNDLRETCDSVIRNAQSIAVLETKVKQASTRNKKDMGAGGGIGALIGVAFATLIDFLMRRG